MTVERTETVIIGGGQAGLTMSHCLTRLGRAHIVLERHRIAERWRSERWDSLRFQFPNWAMRLPDFPYVSDNPDGFAPRDEVVRFIEDYANFIRAPLRTGVEVCRLHQSPGYDGFQLDASAATFEARNVVIATGPYQRPAIPPAAEGINGLFQLAASSYRNPDQLPPGGVLVVGSGASGCQIAEELLMSGRSVFLSVGPHRRVPRRYRGRDIVWWITALGLDEKVADDHTKRQPPLLITGAGDGHTIDLHRFAAAGMVLLGRLQGACDGIASFADDLSLNLSRGDESYASFVRTADAYLAQVGLVLPKDPDAHDHDAMAAVAPDPITVLNLGATGISTVIWATGYGFDFDWVGLDLFDATGQPAHRRGVTKVPGAYFLGLPLLHKTKSSFLAGVGEDAAFLAEQIAMRDGWAGWLG